MDCYLFDETRHLHTLNGKPLTGTSSVVDVLNKPLTWWASGMACAVLGWTHPKSVGSKERLEKAYETFELVKRMSPKEYLALLDKAYKAHNERKKDAAVKGTDLHWALEQTIKCKMGMPSEMSRIPAEGLERIAPFIDWQEKNVRKWLWSETHCYSKELWTGGISDAGALLKDHSVTVFDFKSSKAAYLSSFIQGAGYATEIAENGLLDAKGAKLGLCSKIDRIAIVPFGAEKVEPVFNQHIGEKGELVGPTIEELQKGFEYSTYLYRLLGMSKED